MNVKQIAQKQRKKLGNTDKMKKTLEKKANMFYNSVRKQNKTHVTMWIVTFSRQDLDMQEGSRPQFRCA